MLRNGNYILKNGDRIFKSQVVDSYLKLDTNYTNLMYFGITGSSINNPLNLYYETATGVLKQTITTNSSNVSNTFPATIDTSYKKYYFSGNLNGVYRIRTNNNYGIGKYTGEIISLMNQFPNLNEFDMSSQEADFNQDISNVVFPKTLTNFRLFDRGISGDISSIINFDNIEDLYLNYPLFTGNLEDIEFKNLLKLYLGYLYSLHVNLNTITENNSNLYYFYAWSTQYITLSADSFNMSQFKYFSAYMPYTSVDGNFSGWTFNTGLTYFQIYFNNMKGDISNWDFSDTLLTTLGLNNYGYGSNPVSGDLSGWEYPSTLQSIYFYGLEHITAINGDFSGTALSSINFNRTYILSGDVTTWIFPSTVNSLNITGSELIGNLETWEFPHIYSLQLRGSNFTGNLSGITIWSGTTSVYFDGNLIVGELTSFQYVQTLNYLDVGGNSGVTLNLSSTYNPKLTYGLYIDNIGEISGDWSNLITTGFTTLQAHNNNNITAINIGNLDTSNLTSLQIYSSNLSGDSTGLFTGSTNVATLYMENNLDLSGDTSNWNVNSVSNFRAYNTKLYGTLSHNNVYYLYLSHTNISSNIETAFNFNNRAYWVDLSYADIVGNLSGVTLNLGIYQFKVNNCSNLFGSNEFTNYIFINRKNWTRSNSYFYYQNIGDTVNGTSEILGDLGTWSGSEWDLTEEQVNNLVDGTDYDGLGTNTSWNGKEKIYWIKNALVSSSSSSKRYLTFYIYYS